jgi:hypothetical protein
MIVVCMSPVISLYELYVSGIIMGKGKNKGNFGGGWTELLKGGVVGV